MIRLIKRLAVVGVLGLAVAGALATTTSARPDHGRRHEHSRRDRHGHRHHLQQHGPRARGLTTISCGMTVTQSITVANDLTCPVPAAGVKPFGLIVPPGTSGITINMNGHTLSGPRVTGPSSDPSLGNAAEITGIQLTHSDHVTVKNGTVQHFDAGVVDSYGSYDRIREMRVTDNRNYEVVNGAIDYLPPSPTLNSVTPTGTVTTPAKYTYEVATAQAPNPATTPGDNGSGGSSLTQDSLVSSSQTVTNDATLSSTNYNTIAFTGVAPQYATGYRIIRSINGADPVWIGTVAADPSTNSYTFVDQGQTPASTTPYNAVSLVNNNVSVNDTCNDGDGILLDASSHDTVTGNTASGDGPFDGIAMIGEYNGTAYVGPLYNRIAANHVSDDAVLNLDPGYNNPHNQGLSAYCGTGPGGGGMTRGREVQDSGIRIEGPAAQHNVVAANQVIGSGFNGIAIHSYVCNSEGPQPNGEPNSYNLITHNAISDTGKNTPAGLETNFDGIGWLASGPSGVVCVSPDNTVTYNNSFDNLRNGIYLGGRANGGNLVAHNWVHGNTGAGIYADAGGAGYGNPPNTFTENVGQSNGTADGYDANPGCATNVWSADVFGSTNQPCVK